MAIKTELKLPDTHQAHTFPALYKSKASGSIVLFTTLESGTVIIAGSVSFQSTGYHSDGFEPANNTDNWTRLPVGSKVSLTVKE